MIHLLASGVINNFVWMDLLKVLPQLQVFDRGSRGRRRGLDRQHAVVFLNIDQRLGPFLVMPRDDPTQALFGGGEGAD